MDSMVSGIAVDEFNSNIFDGTIQQSRPRQESRCDCYSIDQQFFPIVSIFVINCKTNVYIIDYNRSINNV